MSYHQAAQNLANLTQLQNQSYQQANRQFMAPSNQEKLIRALRSNPQSFEDLAEQSKILPHVKSDSHNMLDKLTENPKYSIQNIKSSVKNTYIKKISSLLNIKTEAEQER